MQKVFITGSTGFIGQAVVTAFLDDGWDVYALVRPTTIPPFAKHKNLHVISGDMTDKVSLKKGLPTDATIVHLAANPYHPKLSEQVNVDGTRDLLAIAEQKKAKKWIQISSQATKIAKRGVYGTTKNKADDVVRNGAIPFVILKPSLVYGPGDQGLFGRLATQFRSLPFIPMFGNGNAPLYPILVTDLANIIVQVASKSTKTDTYDVGGKQRITYNDLYQSILKHAKLTKKIYHLPIFVGLLGAKILSVLPDPPLNKDNVLGASQDTHCDPNPLLKELKYQSVSFTQGIADVFTPPKDAIKVAIVGLGKMGIVHATILSTLPNVRIVALVDTNKALYQTIASMGAKGTFYTDLNDAFANEKIDAVYICTPTFTHLPLAKIALKHKTAVFIEKPTTISEEDNKELASLAKGLPVVVGYTLLYKRTFMHAKKLIEDGTIGELTEFEATFQHGEVLAPKKGWMYTKKLSGGGALMSPGPHLFSLINYYFGKPRKISGTIKSLYSEAVEDEADLDLTYATYHGNVMLSWSIPNKPISETTIVIHGDKGSITVTDFDISIKVGNKATHLTERDLPAPNFSVFNINPEAHGEAYFSEDYLFIESLKTGKRVVNDLAFGIATEQIIHKAYKDATYEK